MTDLVHTAWRSSTYMDKGVETMKAKVFRDLSQAVIPAMPCVARNSNPVTPTNRAKKGGEDPVYNAL
eukprot:16439681-Heterocapsa_arctica.AAC.1